MSTNIALNSSSYPNLYKGEIKLVSTIALQIEFIPIERGGGLALLTPQTN